MKKRTVFGIVMGCMLMLAAPAMAEETQLRAPATVTSPDGVLSIQLPADNWKSAEDENHLLALTDGADIITVDRYNRTDPLPATMLADDTYGAVYHTFLSTREELFVIKGAAAKEEDLEAVMRSIGTIKLLKPTAERTAVQQTEAASSFGLREINATYYATGNDINVRQGTSLDDEVIGSLSKGAEVHVDGAVTKDGQDYGWYQILFKDKKAYVSAQFLTATKPVEAASAKPASTPAASTSAPAASSSAPAAANNLVYCEYCGQWYEEGNVFRNHICPNRDAAYAAEAANTASTDDLVYCEYCGQWYEPGNEFRNHICPARDAAYAAEAAEDNDDNLVYCEYCGQWYEAGNVFRNHVCPARDAAYANE